MAGSHILRARRVVAVMAACLLLVGGTGCGVEADEAPLAGAHQPTAEAAPSATPAEDPAIAAARACFVGSWLADNAAFGAVLFEQGAITSDRIGGTLRLIASAEGVTASEFEGWSYETLMPGPLGAPTVPMTATRNAVETGSYLVNPDGSITVTPDPTEESTPAEPVTYLCEGDRLTRELLGGTGVHLREG